LDPDVFHQYNAEEASLFVSKESDDVVDGELRLKKGEITDPNQNREISDRVFFLRDYFKSIPQLEKTGPDGVTALYNSGVILTEDLLVGYFDEVVDEPNGEKKDVLHVILLWSEESSSWVMPGKRDQAYDETKPDISIREANLSLVEKEIKVDRTQVVHHAILGYFDDRLRETRGKTSGFVSFVLLNKRPELKPGKMVGVPLNALKLLAERRIELAHTPESGEVAKMGRNHDSLILATFKTAKFCHTMEKVKLNQASFRERLRSDQKAKRPLFSDVDPEQECPVCQDLLVGVHIVCKKGHSLCGICLEMIKTANQPCPICRDPLQPIPNLAVDRIIQYINPEAYRKRYQELHTGEAPLSWEDDPAFTSHFVTYPTA
jgi:hypothetical protein